MNQRFADIVRRAGALGRRLWKPAVAALIAAAALLAVALAWPMDASRYLAVAPSREIVDRGGKLLYPFLNAEEQWCFRRRLEEVSPYLIQATVAAEDERYFRHPGVDPWAVLRAAGQNLRHGRIVSGASTLTMQIVKPYPEASRTIPGKLRQALTALRLERRVSKEAILEAYLNWAPYGLNLQGCEAASRRYFGKPATELAVHEAALIAAIPKAPAGLMPLNHPDRARARRNYVIRRMHACGYITQAQCDRALTQPVAAAWHEFPSHAPHLAMMLRDEPGLGRRIETTLDVDVQAAVEGLLPRYLKRFDGGVTNGAVLIVDVAEGCLLARVGSADFMDTPGGGQVDTVRAPRSPGSTLKPFAYAVAYAHNVLYPSEMLLDDALDYGRYNPENFDGAYHGLIPAGIALRMSLNVPAVTALHRVGVAPMYAFLEDAGFTTLDRDARDYGLGLTLGNCEVRLDELAAAYTLIAHLGAYRPLRVLRHATADAKRLLPHDVCLALFEDLEQPFPREFGREVVKAAGVEPPVAYKTGTSTGFRDAWTVAFNRHYVVAVWLGNNSGAASPQLVGARAALPLAARLFRMLEPKAAPAWPDPAGGLRPVRVCAVSGLPASPACPATRTVSLPRRQYLHRRCDVHAQGPEGVVERWPGAAKGWDLADVREPVASLPGGQGQGRAEELRILNPCERAEYVLTGVEDGDVITLKTSLDAQAPLFWYLNDRFLGASKPGAPLRWPLERGAHKLACATAAGHVDTVSFEVRAPDPAAAFEEL